MNAYNTSVRDKITRLGFWSSRVTPQPLEGGITNTNFIVEDRNQRFVVRVGDDIPIHGVMRFNEIAAARAAHCAGISPEIVYSADGIFIMRFIEGETLTARQVRDQKNIHRILSLIQTCHNDIPKHFRGPALVFWPFQVCRSYILAAKDGNSRMKDILPRFLEINNALEKTVGKVKLVFGHNDLLSANFIDDGKRLWLMDWDYAGYNTALFDLANLCSNNGLSGKQEKWVLERYYQQPVTDRLHHRFAAMKCISLLRETLWSIISEIHSAIDFDYKGYTAENLDRFEKAYASYQEMG